MRATLAMICGVLAGLCLSSSAGGDVLVTSAGTRYEGVVTEEGDQIILTTPAGGKMTFPKAMVKEVIRKPLEKAPPSGAASKPTSRPAARRRASARANKNLLPPAMSSKLDRALVDTVIAEGVEEYKNRSADSAKQGRRLMFHLSSAVGVPRLMDLRLDRQKFRIQHNWPYRFEVAVAGRPHCTPPGLGCLVKAKEMLPLGQPEVKEGVLLYRDAYRWRTVTPQEAATALIDLMKNAREPKNFADDRAVLPRKLGAAGCVMLGPAARPALDQLLRIAGGHAKCRVASEIALDAIAAIGDRSAVARLKAIEAAANRDKGFQERVGKTIAALTAKKDAADAPATRPAGARTVTITNKANRALDLWIDCKPAEIKRKIQPGQTVSIDLPRGRYDIMAGAWPVAPGVGTLLGVVVVKGPEAWTFSLVRQSGQRVWHLEQKATR